MYARFCRSFEEIYDRVEHFNLLADALSWVKQGGEYEKVNIFYKMTDKPQKTSCGSNNGIET